MTIVALRRVGIDEAFVQTAARRRGGGVPAGADGRAGARACSGALAVAALAPVLAAAYDDDRLLGLTLAVTYLPVAFALQAPQWVFFKRMEYVRLRAAAGDRAARDRRGRRCRCCSRGSACGRS